MTGGKNTVKSKQAFLDAFELHLGVIEHICKGIGIDSSTYRRWMQSDPDFVERFHEAKFAVKDWGEAQLHRLINGIPKKNKAGDIVGWILKPDPAATIFFNKTQNKDRGYVERTETQSVRGYSIVVKNGEDRTVIEEIAKTLQN